MLYRMFNIRIVLCTLALTVLGIGQSLATQEVSYSPSPTKYERAYHNGETLNISVLGEDELSQQYTIDDSGMILMPLIGKIQVAGKTSVEIENIIKIALQDGYIKNPVISISATNDQSFYILGEVNAPGRYDIKTESTTILNAIALAGGFTPHAHKRKFAIVRRKGEDKYRTENNSAYTDILPGDIIIVKQRFF